MLETDTLPAEDKMMVDGPDVKPTAEEAAMDDLFGDDNAVVQQERQESTPNEGGTDTGGQEDLSPEEIEHRRQMEYAEEEEDDNDPGEIHRVEAEVSIPSVPKVKSSDGQSWVLRLPNFIKLDSRPFHPQTYIGPEHHEEEGSSSNARERSMSIKLQVENTMRWRWNKDKEGNDVKQSNCRVIRWSDGSQTLLLGKEQFEIVKNVDNSGAPQSSPSKARTAEPDSKSHSLTYLVAQHARSTVLQAEAHVTGTLTLRPMGMQSETHQMLVRAVGQKHNRVARLKMAPDPIVDPEREKLEQLKTQSKKPRKRREKAEDAYGSPIVSRKRTGFLNRKRVSEKLWSDDEEEEPAYGSEGSDEEHRARTTRAAGKHMGEYQTDDFLISDEEDEGEDGDGAGGSGRRKKRRSSDAEEEARDSLDEMEEKMEAESKRRKKRPGAAVDSKNAVQKAIQEEEGEPEMDLESEEEDEEQVIRRRKSSRPKVIVEEEDEE